MFNKNKIKKLEAEVSLLKAQVGVIKFLNSELDKLKNQLDIPTFTSQIKRLTELGTLAFNNTNQIVENTKTYREDIDLIMEYLGVHKEKFPEETLLVEDECDCDDCLEKLEKLENKDKKKV